MSFTENRLIFDEFTAIDAKKVLILNLFRTLQSKYRLYLMKI